MGDRREWARLCLMGLALFVVIAPVRAQYAKPEEEYKKLIHVSEDIQPLGEHPFGANISLYNGGLSFQQTDVSEAGNGLPLKLVRGFKIKGRDYNDTSGENGAFGDWDLVVPHLETLAAWNMGSTKSPALRVDRLCSRCNSHWLLGVDGGSIVMNMISQGHADMPSWALHLPVSRALKDTQGDAS